MRPSLLAHPKFKLLCSLLGCPEAHALGYLELIWSTAYQNGEDYIGSGRVVECIATWPGEPGELVEALQACGQAGRSGIGFIEASGEGFVVHDLFDHAPNYVNRRLDREAERKAKGETISDKRRSAALERWGSTSAPSANAKTRSERLSAARELGTHTAEEWSAMLSVYQRCLRCGAKPPYARLVKDHIVPIYQGGSDAIGNLQPLCSGCNSSKGSEVTDHRVGLAETLPEWLPVAKTAAKMPASADGACKTPANVFPPAPAPAPAPALCIGKAIPLVGEGDARGANSGPPPQPGPDPGAPPPDPRGATERANRPAGGKSGSRWKCPDPPLPPILATPEFRTAWDARRREREEPGIKQAARPTESSLLACLAKLAKLAEAKGIDAAIAAVERATEGRYQGVVFAEDFAAGTNGRNGKGPELAKDGFPRRMFQPVDDDPIIPMGRGTWIPEGYVEPKH